jgi:hypothetical protein
MRPSIERRVLDSGGSCRHGLGSRTEPRIPLAECGFPLPIEHPRADLQQQMRPAWGPGHLLFLAEALADHLIDRRFHEAGADPLSCPVALARIRNEALVIRDIGVELLCSQRAYTK